MLTNIKKKAIVQGASTISQQYIKNLYLDFDKTWERKIKEEERKMKNRGRENPLSLGALKSFINLFLFRMINTKRVKIDGMKREA